jgi:putative hydrolase of the HAD superfamily
MDRWPRAIFVDLDNTLHDYTGAADAARRSLAYFIHHEFGISVEAVLSRYSALAEEISADLFESGAEWRRKRFRALLDSWPQTKSLDEAVIAEDFADALKQAITPAPGALTAIDAWQERGIKVLIVTEGFSDIQLATIETLGLARLERPPLVSSAYKVRKRDGSAYLLGLQMVNALPEDVVMVGDNWDWDVMAPARCGIWQIWVSTSPALPASPPPRFIARIAELRDANPALTAAKLRIS